MPSSWNLASRAEPSWKFSEPNRAELAAFEKRAEYELDFFLKPISISVNAMFYILVFTVLFQRSFRKRRQFYENCCYIRSSFELICYLECAKIWITFIWISHKKIYHKIHSLQIARNGQIFAKRAVPKIARAELKSFQLELNPSWAEPSSARGHH